MQEEKSRIRKIIVFVWEKENRFFRVSVKRRKFSFILRAEWARG